MAKVPSGADLKLVHAVSVYVKIGKDGHVTNPKVADNPLDAFDLAAMAAVQTWLFEPATYQGLPIAVFATVQVKFKDQPGSQPPSLPPRKRPRDGIALR